MLEGASDALEMGLHIGVNCPLWVLGMVLGVLLEPCMLLPMETSLRPSSIFLTDRNDAVT